MKPSQALENKTADVRRIVEANRGRNVRVFGSVLVGEDTETSDLDLLIDPLPGMTLFDLGAMRYELRELLGVQVDVLTPGSLPDYMREDVLEQAKPL